MLFRSYEVVSNRPKVNSFRAPCVPQVVFGVEGVIDELARKIGMDPIDFRLKNAATEGYKTIYGETFGPIGFVETLKAAKACAHYNSPVPAGQGRGVAAGFWFNKAGETAGSLNIAIDGSVTLSLGTTDVAGSRIAIGQQKNFAIRLADSVSNSGNGCGRQIACVRRAVGFQSLKLEAFRQRIHAVDENLLVRVQNKS